MVTGSSFPLTRTRSSSRNSKELSDSINSKVDCEIKIFPAETNTQDIINYNPGNGTIDTTYQTANPLHFATPSGYQHIEGGKGTSNNDKNFITLTSGPKATETLENNIKVVPNPYIARSNYNETEYLKQIRFTNLPQQCVITIYTISGEKVISLNHSDIENGSKFWNLRSINNQEVAPGLYIYVVEDTNSNNERNKFIGKFAIVR